MKTTLIFSAMLAGAACAFAAETVDFSAKDFKQNASLTVKDGVITVPGRQLLSARKLFPIDGSKVYKVSLDMRTAQGGKTMNYVGFQICDEKGKEFNPNWVHTVSGTEGTLAEPCKKDDTSLKIRVKNPNAWKSVSQFYTLAFDAKEDLADLPNRTISGFFKGGATKREGDVVTVALRGKAKFDRPAGTPVRVHASAGHLYVQKTNVPDSWTTVGGQVSGFSQTGGSKQWWKGGKNARLVILPGWNQKGSEMELRNIRLTIE